MAMTIKTDGLEELGAMMAKLGEKANEVAGKSLYEGADVVGDAFTKAISSIKTEPIGNSKRKMRLPSPEEKAALEGKSGIAKFRNTGDGVDTMIGISGAAGYASVNGKPKAVRLIARAINSGTSFMKKPPVFRKAVNSSKAEAQAKIADKAEELFNEIIGG